MQMKTLDSDSWCFRPGFNVDGGINQCQGFWRTEVRQWVLELNSRRGNEWSARTLKRFCKCRRK